MRESRWAFTPYNDFLYLPYGCMVIIFEQQFINLLLQFLVVSR